MLLSLLTTLDGGLIYTSPAALTSQQRQGNAHENKITRIDEDVNNLRERLDNLDALVGRFKSIEDNAQKLRSDVESSSSHTQKLSQEVEVLNSSME